MDRHSILRPGNLLMVQERERLLARLLSASSLGPLEELRVFEAGCSTAYNLRLLVQWGCRPEHLAGIDLDPDAVAYARSRSPGIRIHEGRAQAIAEPDGAFDLTLAFTLLSSAGGPEPARAIAAELVRITRVGGLVLVYDMRRRSTNPSVRRVSRADIQSWFPRCRIRSRSLTLAPPLARAAGSRAPWAYGPMAALPFLRTHALHMITVPRSSG